MPRHEETRRLPYSQEELFKLVAEVEKYPEFLPWCIGARILKRTDREIWADLVIGFKVFRETFTSRVLLDPPGLIEVEYVKGPLKHLTNRWEFIAHDDGTCTIDFVVDFEFRNHLFERLVGGLFTEAVHRMVMAFEKRARVVYGEKSLPGD